MKKLIALIVLVAFSAHADSVPAPQAAPGEIIVEQHTQVYQGTRGTITQRYVRLKMRIDGTERVLSTRTSGEWMLQDGPSSVMESPLVDSSLPEERGVSYQLCRGRRRLDGGALGKRVEDGVTVTGEWVLRECAPADDRPLWTEREETWYRADAVGGKKVLRPHSREVRSPFASRRIDYLYVQSARLHRSLFDEKLP